MIAEYIWIDGTIPTAKLRSKTRVILGAHTPEWSFDGSSTNQSEGRNSDCKLHPIMIIKDPLRKYGENNILILCESYYNGLPALNNNRARLTKVAEKFKDRNFIFGIEQEYTLFKGHSPLGWPDGGYPPNQGPFYCGVGADETFGREVVEDHLNACYMAGIDIAGVNAEVMPGQWEFQIGPNDAVCVSDQLWLARYLLYRIAEKYGITVKLDPKPIRDLNGAGMHTNFSSEVMRNSLEECERACRKLGSDVVGIPSQSITCGRVEPALKFPTEYGYDSERRLTGLHETCSYEEFKYGIADRTASIRIPAHVKEDNGGYVEDRRPSANADPYSVTRYILEVTNG